MAKKDLWAQAAVLAKNLTIHAVLASQLFTSIGDRFGLAALGLTVPDAAAQVTGSHNNNPLDTEPSTWTDQALTKSNFLDLAEKHPSMVFYGNGYAQLAKQPFAHEVFVAAAKKDGCTALEVMDQHQDAPWYKDVMQAAQKKEALLSSASTGLLITPLLRYDLFKNLPYALDVIITAAQKYPAEYLKFLGPDMARPEKERSRYSTPLGAAYDTVVNTILSKDVLMAAARQSDNMIENYPYYKNKSYALDVVAETLKSHPAAYYAKRQQLFSNAKSLGKTYQDDLRMIDRLAHNVMLKMQQQPDGMAPKEYERLCLALVKTTNDFHESPNVERFAPIADFSAGSLFDILTFGREEIYTSSFDGVMDRLSVQMKKEGKDYLYFSRTEKYRDRLVTFLEAASSYNRIDEIFQNLPNDGARQELAQAVFQGLEDSFKPQPKTKESARLPQAERSLHLATALADLMQITTSKNVLSVMEQTLIEAYQAATNPDHKIVLGLVASTYLGDHSSVQHPALFASEDFKKEYPIQTSNKLTEDRLFTKGKHYQQMIFYDDQDGQESYDSTIKYLAETGKNKWTLEDKGLFVVLTSPAALSKDRQIIICANKPAGKEAGQDAASAYLHGKPLQSIVHRGHSYHVGNTIQRLQADLAFLFLGSCGGYQRIASVLGRASDAAISSTKGMGTKYVNNPLLGLIYTHMLKEGVLDWNKLWGEAQKKISSPQFANYVSPAKNMGVRFYLSFKNIKETMLVAPAPHPVLQSVDASAHRAAGL